jgi:N-acetylmuramoyl-L-alanine amidase
MCMKFKIAAVFVLILAVFTASYLVGGYITEQGAKAYERSYAISSREGDYMLLARLVSGEARGEPYHGQVAVASVILNRVRHPRFPNSVAGVVYQPGAFESVRNGQIWADHPSRANFNAARQALDGWDPTYGCLYFWNPYKRVSPWIWTRTIITQIGKHVFGK